MSNSLRKRILHLSRHFSRRVYTPFIAGITVGIAVGLSAGLLFAPASGDKTRRVLRREIQRGTRAIGGISDSASEIGRKVLKTAV